MTTRHDLWLRLVAAAMARGDRNEQARASADEQLAHADDRWPSETMSWHVEHVPKCDAKEGE